MKKLFTPFASVDSRVLATLAASQALFVAVLWVSVPHSVVPGPVEVVRAWNRLAAEDGLLLELWSSAATIAKAIAVSVAISVAVSCLSVISFFGAASRWITSLRFLGFAGITFVFTLATSSGSELKLWLLVFGMTVFLLTNLIGTMSSVSQQEVDYCRTIGLSPWRTVYEVFLRGKMADILDLTRQNAAIGWTMLSMVEGLVRSEGGIGAMLINQNRYFHLDAVFAIQATILLYGIFQDYALRVVRSAVCPYTKMVER